MNFLRLFTAIAPALLKVKQMVFADGKFSLKRAGVILVSIILVAILNLHFDPVWVDSIIEQADEVSDMIGYVE